MFPFLQAIWDEVMFKDQSKWQQNSARAKIIAVRMTELVWLFEWCDLYWVMIFFQEISSYYYCQLKIDSGCASDTNWSTKENYFWKILFLKYLSSREIQKSIKSLLFLFLFNFIWMNFQLWGSMWINAPSLYIRTGNFLCSLVLYFYRECEQSSSFPSL